MLLEIAQTFVATCRDVFPVLVLIAGFQFIILRQSIPHLRQVVVGFGFVLIGLTLFLVGLEKALFPLGKIMATQLSAPEFVFGTKIVPDNPEWWAYGWVYMFAALVGFATTIAEPALIAVAYKTYHVSGGTISQWGLRLVVAFGVAIGIALGTFRIVHCCGDSNHFRTKSHHTPRLRFRRGNHVYRDRPVGRGPGTGSFGNHTGTQPGLRRLWFDRLRQPVSNNNSDGLCPVYPVVDRCTSKIYQGEIA
jgi:hypothetical protein